MAEAPKNPRYRGFSKSPGYPKMRGQDGRRAGKALGSMKGTGGGKPPKKGCKSLVIIGIIVACTAATSLAMVVTQLLG